jgi:predicted PurR-regulated permease PerM
MDRRLFFTLGLFALSGAVTINLYQIFAPFLSSLLWASFLAIVFYPLYQRLLRRLKGPTLTSLVMCVGLTLLVLLPLSLLLLVVFQELIEGLGQLTQSAQNIDLDRLSNLPVVKGALKYLSRYVDISAFNVENALLETARNVSQFLIDRSRDFLQLFSGVLLLLLLVEINLFFLLRDGHRLVAYMRSLMPVSEAAKEVLFSRSQHVINASITVGVMAAVIQGFLGGLGFLLVGLPSPVMWGCLMVMLAFIPVVGTGLIWLPAALFLLIQGSWFKALVLVLWGSALMAAADNIVRPLMMNRMSSTDTRLHTLLMFLSVLGGIQAFGMLGIVMGPLLVVVGLTLLEFFRLEFRPHWNTGPLSEEGATLPGNEAAASEK